MTERGQMKVKKKKPVIGLEQLKIRREETIKRWEKLGLLEGLEGNLKENVAKLFESDPIQRIDDIEDTK